MVQKIRRSKTKNDHKGESHVISPYAHYFYSVDLGKHIIRIVEKHNKKYEVEMLLGSKNGQRVYLRFEYIREGIMQMAKYLVDSKATITAKLKEMKKPTLAKLDLKKERLYESLDGQPLSERLEIYGQISDVLLRIEKLSKPSKMIENYMRIARKLSNEFDILLVRELFYSINLKGLDVNMIVSSGIDATKIALDNFSCTHMIKRSITHLFVDKIITINLYIL